MLREAFAALMSASEADLATATQALVGSASGAGAEFAGNGVAATSGSTLAELVTRLHGQFGADYGLFVLFFLNFVTLNPGEALFLRADDIHAYVSGDIIECMASSDNVVRAGFTPKFKDVDTLVSMLTYNYAPIDEQKMEPADYPYATPQSGRLQLRLVRAAVRPPHRRVQRRADGSERRRREGHL